MPTLFISHGGGPWPYVPEMREQFVKTAHWLEGLPKTLPEKPKAILSISGHWEEPEFTVSTAEKPPMIYDYSGFPESTYRIQYPAKGSVDLANEVRNLLYHHGIRAKEDSGHGMDHGTFVPLVLMYPDAEVPVVSLSLKNSYSPQEHIFMGEALRPLRDEGVLIMGSGLSYHNLRYFGSSAATPVSQQFGKWLGETVEDKETSRRFQKLIHWEEAPSARLAHPQEDHLLPLMVVVGAAGEDLGKTAFVDNVMGVEMASYRFG